MATLCVMLFAVCLSDYRSARIPNMLLAGMVLWGLCYRCCGMESAGMWAGLQAYLSGSLPVFLLLYPLFKIGTVGAGDVKLFAAVAGYLSGCRVYCFLFYSLLISAIFSLLKLIKEKSARERFRYFLSYLSEVAVRGQWALYLENEKDKRKAGICLSGPVLLSVLLYLGGVY